MTIIGVVGTTREFETPEVEGSVYMPGGGGFRAMAIVVRTEGDPLDLFGPLRAQVTLADPGPGYHQDRDRGGHARPGCLRLGDSAWSCWACLQA